MADILPYLPALAIVGSTAVAAFMANKAINSQCKTARTKATLDLIINNQESRYHEELYTEFKSVRDNDGLESLLENGHSSVAKSRAKIQDFLNYYESICIGFDKGILDERFYRDYWGSTFVQHWNDSESLIKKVQSKSPKAYINFEKYAKSWERNVLVTK